MTAKEKPNETSKIIQLFLDCCKARDHRPIQDEELDFCYRIMLRGDNGHLICTLTFDAEEEQVLINALSIMKFPKSTLSELYKLTNEINNKHVSSKLLLNTEDNYVALEAIKRYAEIGDLYNLWKNIEIIVGILDCYIPAFHLVIYGTMDADKALETVKRLAIEDIMEEAMEELPN